MNHHKAKIKKSSKKHPKKKKPKKLDIEKIMKKKTFKVGSTHQELRIQFGNFAERFFNLKSSTQKTYNQNKHIKEMTEELKIRWDSQFDLNGLSIGQLQYRVRKLKRMLDTLRVRRKTLHYTSK